MAQQGTAGKPRAGWWRRWGRWAAVAVVLVLLVVKFTVVDVFVIPQAGMYPSVPAGKRFLAWRHPYRNASDVRRGDVIVFQQGVDGKTYNFIWRVIGLPGERVQVAGTEVRVNGQALRHDDAGRRGGLLIYRETNGPATYEVAYSDPVPAAPPPDVEMTVPADSFFVLGDNRHNAADSRVGGPVPFTAIIAKKW
jgi:signal peptidase I